MLSLLLPTIVITLATVVALCRVRRNRDAADLVRVPVRLPRSSNHRP